MAVLDRPQQHKQLTTYLVMSILIGVLLFTVLLITSATNLSQRTGVITGSIGPLKLFELSKIPLSGGGYSGGVRFIQQGLLAYFVIWLSLGAAYWTVRSKMS